MQNRAWAPPYTAKYILSDHVGTVEAAKELEEVLKGHSDQTGLTGRRLRGVKSCNQAAERVSRDRLAA